MKLSTIDIFGNSSWRRKGSLWDGKWFGNFGGGRGLLPRESAGPRDIINVGREDPRRARWSCGMEALTGGSARITHPAV